MALASMMSISKGFYGECGRRGGYTELINFAPEVVAECYKLASINLCSNLNGQICMALVMNPPKVPPPSYTCSLSLLSLIHVLQHYFLGPLNVPCGSVNAWHAIPHACNAT